MSCRSAAFTACLLAALTAAPSGCTVDSPGSDDAQPAATPNVEAEDVNTTPAGDVEAAPPVEPAAQRQSSGIRGKVLRGPLAGGPLVGDQPDEAPFRATFIVTDGDGNEVGRFQSDDDGSFELALAPGDYVIVPEASAPVFRPEQQQQAVTVPEGEMVELTLRYDTGMR